MNKITYLIAILLLYSFDVNSQVFENEESLKDFGLKGNVKKISYTESDEYTIEEYSYSFNRDKKILKNESLFYTQEYVYDDKGQLKKIYSKISSKIKDSTKLSYNSKGLLVERQLNEQLIKYDYDSKGRKISEQTIGKQKDTSTINFSYDNNDRLVKITYPPKKKEGYYTYLNFKYDDKNNMLSAIDSGDTIPNSYNERTIRLFSYNNNNDIISFQSTTKYFTDKKLWSTEVSSYSIKYISYDSKQNWTKKIITYNNGAVTTITRKIEYFE